MSPDVFYTILILILTVYFVYIAWDIAASLRKIAKSKNQPLDR